MVCAATPLLAQDEQSTIIVDPRVTVGLVREAFVSARDAGSIDQISVREGEMVKEGQVLAILDNDEQTLAARAAELSLKVATTQAEDGLAIDAAQIQLLEAESSKDKQEVALRIAENQATSDIAIKVAESQKELAGMELERARRGSGIIQRRCVSDRARSTAGICEKVYSGKRAGRARTGAAAYEAGHGTCQS